MKGFWTLLLLSLCLALPLAACGGPGDEVPAPGPAGQEEADTPEDGPSSQTGDYPPVIQVDGIIYLCHPEPIPGEVAEQAVIGRTTSYTDTFPTRDGETNFNPELDMPYARVEQGLAVLYENEWRLCTPYNG